MAVAYLARKTLLQASQRLLAARHRRLQARLGVGAQRALAL